MNGTLKPLEDDIWALDISGDLCDLDVPILERAVAAIDDRVECLIIRGGQPNFNSGAARSHLIEADRTVGEGGAALCRLLLDVPVPTVAAMAGHAIGGGLVLGLWCDVIVLARESLYGANFMALGFTPGMGATVALEDAFGRLMAHEMLYTGRLVTGAELKRLGASLPHVLPRAQVMDEALHIARQICGSTRQSVRLLRSTFAGHRRQRLEAAVAHERSMHLELFSNPDTIATIQSRLPEVKRE